MCLDNCAVPAVSSFFCMMRPFAICSETGSLELYEKKNAAENKTGNKTDPGIKEQKNCVGQRDRHSF